MSITKTREVFSLPNVHYAEFSYIFLLLHLSFNGITKQFLMAMGKQSMVMWLTHSFFCYHIFHDFIYGFKYPLVIYIVLIVISYVISLPISYLSKAVIQRVAFLK